MTTDNQDVSASPQDDSDVSAAVEQAAEEVVKQIQSQEPEGAAAEVAEPEAPQALTAEGIAKIVRDEVAASENRIQGRNANYNAETRKSIADVVESVIKNQRDTEIEEYRVSQLEPEQQAAYWREKATERVEVVEPQVVDQRDYSSVYMAAHRLQEVSGLNIDVTGNTNPEQAREFWSGVSDSWTDTEMINFATIKVKEFKAKAAPPPPRKDGPAPVVSSTKGGAQATGLTFNSRAELADYVIENGVDSDTSAALSRTLIAKGSVTV